MQSQQRSLKKKQLYKTKTVTSHGGDEKIGKLKPYTMKKCFGVVSFQLGKHPAQKSSFEDVSFHVWRKSRGKCVLGRCIIMFFKNKGVLCSPHS